MAKTIEYELLLKDNKMLNELNKLEKEIKQLTDKNKNLKKSNQGLSKEFTTNKLKAKKLRSEYSKLQGTMMRGGKATNKWSQAMGSFAFKFNTLGNLVGNGLMQLGMATMQFVKGSVDAFHVQEQAVADNVTAFGDYSIVLQKTASDIQKVTTVGDEQTLQLMTQAKNFGISTSKIGEATKGAIGLAEKFKKAGLGQETALKGVALAYAGDFTQLQRYIPALKTASSDAEKMAIIQAEMADGFDLATEAAKTQGGQMQQLSNDMGDVQEKIGQMISQALILFMPALKKLTDGLNDFFTSANQFETTDFTTKLKMWSNGVVETMETILTFGANKFIPQMKNIFDFAKFDTDKDSKERDRLAKQAQIKLNIEEKYIAKINKSNNTAYLKRIAESDGSLFQYAKDRLAELEELKKVNAEKEKENKKLITKNAEAELKANEKNAENIKKSNEKNAEAEWKARNALKIQEAKWRDEEDAEMWADWEAEQAIIDEQNAVKLQKEKDAREKELALQEEIAQRAINIEKIKQESINALKQGAIDFAIQLESELFNSQQINLSEELKLYDFYHNKELESLQNQLDNGSISQEEYEKSKITLEEEYNKKATAIKKKQFELEKKQKIASVWMDVAKGIASIISKWAWNPFVSALLSAGAVTMGSIQSANIAKQQFYGEDGGMIYGDSHSNGGVNVQMEGEEYLVNKKATAKYKPLINDINNDRLDLQPQKVYVVSHEISNRQYRDTKITNRATF